MKRLITSSLIVAALAGSTLGHAAPVTYTYTGSTFTFVSNDQIGPAPVQYTASDRLSGSFTLANALSGGLSDYTFVPASFSFSDGHHTYSDANITLDSNSYFRVSTDVVGDIVGWTVRLVDRTNSMPFGSLWAIESRSNNFGNPNNPVDFADAYNCGSTCSQNVGSSSARTEVVGSWQSSVSQVPEPATIMLTGLALTAMGVVRRRKAAPPMPA